MHLAREALGAWFRKRGFEVTAHTFRASPRALRALPTAGAGLMILAPILLAALLEEGASLVPMLVLLGGVLLVLLAALVSATRGGHDREDANLIVQAPGVRPATWVVAHLDTKAQGHSMAGRLVALWSTIAAILLAGTAAGAHAAGMLPDGLAVAAAIAILLSGRLLVQGRLMGKTAGACDNGSGLVGLLVAADRRRDGGLGFIVTSAEEFGLVGATALARDLPGLFQGTRVVNLDTLDDRGTLYVVRHDARSARLAGRLEADMAGVAPVVRQRRLPLGILVDSLPLSRVATEAVTLGRLDWATLRRLHTPADAPGTLAYSTAVSVGEALASRFDPAPNGG